MLYGVRFGPTTRYCVLDVDKGSAYHPTRDRFAWRRLVAALEVLGLVQAVLCTSSYSGGLHLYFPFDTSRRLGRSPWRFLRCWKTVGSN
jgi:hypothetical protein